MARTVCSKCGAVWDRISHPKNKQSTWCKECTRKDKREYYQKNKLRFAAYRERYRRERSQSLAVVAQARTFTGAVQKWLGEGIE